ncbi:hypothetical protein IAR55_003783 [Kwoniella newhampshirensis]|uniref:Uncharacterized protein n=1 Tax=Kwoniella newhampshirensis TaxID=1651941 RepID=A0AAW0YY85_9TREE
MSFLPGGNTVPFSYSTLTGATAQTSGFAQAAAPAPGDGQVSGNHIGVPPGGGLASSPNVPRPGTSIDPATGKPHTAGLTRAELEAKKAAAAGVAAFGGGGGLGSSPNVPAPGTSINPETGLPHTAGLTRAELEQIKAKGADLLDPTPLNVQARRGSDVKSDDIGTAATGGRRLSDLSGREQAALQLSGAAGLAPVKGKDTESSVTPTPQSGTSAPPAPAASDKTAPAEEQNYYQTAGEMTPGLELPGGWGPVKTTGFPGSGPDAPTSLYEDVAQGLDKVGRAAFASIPSPIKDAFSSSSTDTTKSVPTPANAPAPRSPTLSAGSPGGRRASAAAIFDQAKEQANKVLADVQGTLQNTQRRASANLGNASPLLQQVRNFVGEALNTAPAGSASLGFVGTHPGAPPLGIAPRFSFPSQEPAGARPGEHTSGVGALPGPSTESGVAVLPEEKKAQQTLPSQENQGVLPGETSGGIGALPGKHGETGVAELPDEKTTRPYSDSNPISGSSGSAGPSGSREFTPGFGETTTAAPADHNVSGLTTTEVPHIREQAATPLVEEAPDLTTAQPNVKESSGLITSTVPDVHAEVSTTAITELESEPASAPTLSSAQQHTSAPTSAFDTETVPAPTSSFVARSEERPDGAGFAHPVSGGQEPSSSAVPVHAEDQPVTSSTTSTKSLGTSYGGLAPALPATVLGLGAARGATDLETAPVASDTASTPASADSAPIVDSSSTTTDHESSPLATVPETASATTITEAKPSTLSPGSQVPETRHANDRTTSTASVTAIRHGHEGTGFRGSPLVEESNLSSSGSVSDGQRSTTAGTGSSHTTSLTPGKEHEGIGHPATRAVEGATREPGSYPTPEHARDPSAASALHEDSATHGHTTDHHSGLLADERARAKELINEPAHPIHTEAGEDVPPLTNKAHPALDEHLAHNTSDKHTPLHDHLQDPAPHHTSVLSTPSKPATPSTPPQSPVATTNGRSSVVGSSSPTTPKASVESGHRRTDSGASGEKKKKHGFMSKIKEKLSK